MVFFAHSFTPEQRRAQPGFGISFNWDVDLTAGFSHRFLVNASTTPGTDHFWGCDVPDIEEHFRKGRFDALLITGWGLKVYLQAVLAAKKIGLPVMVRGDSNLVTPRSFFKRVTKSLGYRVFLRMFDAGLYVGERNRQYWLNYGYPAERLFHSPHCVDVDFFGRLATKESRVIARTRLGIDERSFVVLFAGRLLRFKRPLDVVKGVSLVRAKRRDVQLLIAGAGELQDALVAQAQLDGIPLHLAGFQNQSEMPAAYAAADVLVLPSDGGETWGLVCNEALASGCPVIVSDACGCAEDIARTGGPARRFICGNVEDLSRCLQAVAEAPPSKAEIEALSQQFSPERAAEGIMRATEAVCLYKHMI